VQRQRIKDIEGEDEDIESFSDEDDEYDDSADVSDSDLFDFGF
jgi:hypothetical protein